tara:strand:- start:2261 stop:2410 length:150 start_codon:yes stop_codon:yes gene_type:complete
VRGLGAIVASCEPLRLVAQNIEAFRATLDADLLLLLLLINLLIRIQGIE